jgi:hypothetical protein
MATQQDKNTHSNLLSLSDELLLEIVEFASVRARSSWLLNLCTCSRRLYNITEPILYTRIKEWGESLPKLLCRIVERPDLGRRVKSWSGAAVEITEEEGSFDMSTVEEAEWERIRGTVNQIELNENNAHSWFEAIQDGSWDAMTALLLHLLPNLRELNFSMWSPVNDDGWTGAYNQYPFTQDTVTLAASEASILTKLESFSIEADDDEECGLCLSQFVPFLQIPSLLTFTAFAVSNEINSEEYLQFNGLQHCRFSVKNLSLINSNLHSIMLKSFFGCFSRLETLHYVHGARYFGHSDFEPSGMMEALQCLKPTLKELHIIVEDMEAEDYAYPIASFSDFDHLKILTITTPILLDDRADVSRTVVSIDCLPSSIESLTLEDFGSAFKSWICELVWQKRFRTPNLKYLDLGWQGTFDPDEPSSPVLSEYPGFLNSTEAEKFLWRCKEAGIELQVKYLSPGKRVCFQCPHRGFED